MEKNKKKPTGWDERVRGELRKFIEVYALLAARFSLRLWLVRRREGQRYASTRVAVHMALTMHLCKVEMFFVAFLCVSQRAFRPKRFLCYSAVFSAIQKLFSCCFTILLFFILARCQRAQLIPWVTTIKSIGTKRCGGSQCTVPWLSINIVVFNN